MQNLKTFLVVVFLLSVSCSSDDELVIFEEIGTIENAPMGYEECGWLININGVYIKPSRLTSQYEQEGLEVRVSYERLDEQDNCPTANTPLDRVRILQIQPF